MEQIKFSSSYEDAKLLQEQGCIPVECSFGTNSLVDEFVLDHHGKYSHMDGVAIRGYRDFFGKGKGRNFVINHLDADNTFCIAAMLGILPGPFQEKAKSNLTEAQRYVWTKDWSDLAETINILDTDPIGRNPFDLPYGDIVIAWNILYGSNSNDELGFWASVNGWRWLLTNCNAHNFIAMASNSESYRKNNALKDMEKGQKIGSVYQIPGSRVFGFNEWYARNRNYNAYDVEGWHNPIVAALVDTTGKITIGCPNQVVAEKLFGYGGLKKVFAKLNQKFGFSDQDGFGGREAIGGSPRGKAMNENTLRMVTDVINEMCCHI